MTSSNRLSWKWVYSSLPNTSSSLVRLDRHFGDVYPKKMVKIRQISVYFHHFWSLCDGQHCSVGLLWGIWIEPNLLNTHMLLIWPENPLESYPQKMMKIWTISVSFDDFWSLCDGQHCSVRLLWEIWIESYLPDNLMLSVRPENHFEVIYLQKTIKIWTISVSCDHFWSPCNGQHCSVEILWEIWIESCPPNTFMLSVQLGNHFEVINLEKMV